jgi:hypothetical protein
MNDLLEQAVPVSRAELEQLATLLGPDSYAVAALVVMQQREARGEVVGAYYNGSQIVVHGMQDSAKSLNL